MDQTIQIQEGHGTTVDIALVGNPNTGKTSIFNALTGLRQKIGNYPGVTVEKKIGTILGIESEKIHLHDLPGMYSLNPKSMDEKIARDVLVGESPDGIDIKLVVVVADASNLSRNLYLVTQVIDLGIPVIMALNMMDSAETMGIQIDVAALAGRLGVPVIPVIAVKKKGIDQLQLAIFERIYRPSVDGVGTLQLGADIDTAITPITAWMGEHTGLSLSVRKAEALRILSSDLALNGRSPNGQTEECTDHLNALVRDARTRLEDQQISWRMLETTLRYQHIDDIYTSTVRETSTTDQSISFKLDRVLTHRIGGPIIVLGLFAFIFQSIFSWAEIPMDATEAGVTAFGAYITELMPAGILRSLIVDGIIAGVGAVLVFLPQILFLFFFLALLEDTGYMARVAFLTDRLMRSLGLSGRSMIPLLSSFACAIPGVMATRTISNTRDRLITIMIAPMMSCSARLPVYILMIGALIPNVSVLGVFSLPGLTLLSMYLIGMTAAVCAALVFKRLFMKGAPSTPFIMELPPYRRPSIRWVSLQMFERAKIFVRDAGRIILTISIVLWFLASYPRPDDYDDLSSRERIHLSYAGQLGHFIEPVIAPLGFDWKLGIGLITSFAAREVMVSTLATIYNVEEADETSVDLRTALRGETHPVTGKPIYTPLVAISLMVFFALACQCMATVAIVKRETNSWRWPILMIAYMTGLAYLASFVVYQSGQLLGLG